MLICLVMGDFSDRSRERTQPKEPVVSLVGVVDDDESVREAISSLLRSAGYRCSVFPSAKAFLDSDTLEATDCMVLDVRMPEVTGPELQTKLRAMNSAVPVIFVTAPRRRRSAGESLARRRHRVSQ